MNEPPLHLCIDRFAPLAPSIVLPDGRLAGVDAKFWPQHQRVLHVRFLGGDPRLHERVARIASQWMQHAHIRFVFDNNPHASIRISFEPGGSWSYIGTDALDPLLGPDDATMNFGWLTPATPNDEVQRVVLHEFGHALGMIHEHQSPTADIPWDRDVVIAHFSSPPNNWSLAEIERNIFFRYRHDQANASGFDPASIMVYHIPPEFTRGQYTVAWNRLLSSTDRAFIGKLYPPPGQ